MKLFAMLKIGVFFDKYMFGIYNSFVIKKWEEMSRVRTWTSSLEIFIFLTVLDIIGALMYLFQLLCFHNLLNSDYGTFWVVNILGRMKFFNFKVSPLSEKGSKGIQKFD